MLEDICDDAIRINSRAKENNLMADANWIFASPLYDKSLRNED